ncbi:MAG: hypothetical protein J6L77_11370 [Coprococcus sp.]|nr:hypothetical protein [Coprococcus sp.]
MKKINYVIKSFLIDKRENFRIFLFAIMLSFVGLFFICNIKLIKSHIGLLDNLSGAYFITVENSDYTYTDVRQITQKFGKLHFVTHIGMDVNGDYCEGYIYDEFIINHISYNFERGKSISNENEVIISQSLGERYDIGDTITLGSYDKDGEYVEKNKVICGVLDSDIIYYPTGTGDVAYDFLVVDLTDELYSRDAIITIDKLFRYGDMESEIFMLEPNLRYEKSALEELFIDIGEVYEGKEIIDRNAEYLMYEKNQKKVFAISGLVVGLSVFLGGIYISVIRRRREFGIMLLSGANYVSTLLLLRLNGLLSVIMGAFVGEAITICLINRKVLEGEINIVVVLVVFAIMILLYIICTLIIGACWKREEIVDLITKDI